MTAGDTINIKQRHGEEHRDHLSIRGATIRVMRGVLAGISVP
jgi:hypothetical protein